MYYTMHSDWGKTSFDLHPYLLCKIYTENAIFVCVYTDHILVILQVEIPTMLLYPSEEEYKEKGDSSHESG